MAMKIKSLRDLEERFAEEAVLDRERRAELSKTASQRERIRKLEKQHKHGTARFVLLVLTIIATAVIVTIVMFETLAIVFG